MDNQHRQSNALLAWSWLWLALLVLLGATFLAWWQDPLPAPPNREPQAWSFWKPIETNPHRRLATIDRHFSYVTFTDDGLRGWVAGGESILATTDGGKNWTVQANDTSGYFNAIHFHSDGLRGWAVGGDGKIAATTDGGQTWKSQTSHTTEQLNAVKFNTDGQRGMVVGENGIILSTTNGGQTWIPQNSNGKKSLSAIQLHADGLRGWVTGRDYKNAPEGVILSTIDSGKTWITQSSAQHLTAIHLNNDGLHGWAVGWIGAILTTEDGGKTWKKQNSSTTSFLNSICFQYDGLHGWAAGSEGTILVTGNGGNTWEKQRSNTSNELKSIHFHSDGLHGWAVGEKGTILSTRDGGVNWTLDIGFTTDMTKAIQFDSNGVNGWMLNYVHVFSTKDGGETWSQSGSSTGVILQDLYVHADSIHAWLVGNGYMKPERGVLFSTTDAGESWIAKIIPDTTGLRTVYFHSDKLHGWVIDNKSNLLLTSDGGATWQRPNIPLTISFSKVLFSADGLHGWGIGVSNKKNVILLTVDGGKIWAEQTNQTKPPFSTIAFHSDGLRGWAADTDGSIFTTSDSGKTWTNQLNKTGKEFTSVHFLADGLRGWIVGSDGAVLTTINGGNNWTPQNSNTTQDLSDIQFLPDGLHGWMIGDAGSVFSTRDGGKTWRNAEPYRRMPAPWYWLAVALSAWLGWLGWLSWQLRAIGLTRESIANVAASDAEIRKSSEDRLEFIGLARGISRFLRNAETRPPLTLAITGDWGSGKSSLMQLVCADLRASGHRPIWFNAWHHQKEEHLFAALLGAVYAQAVPSLWSWQGWSFRLHMLWLRSTKHFWLLIVLVMAMTVALVVSLPALQQGKFKDISDNFASLQQWGAPVLAGLTALFALWKGMRPFGVNPALLLTRLRDNLSLRAASAQNDFRAQFARQFGELVQALPYRLVLVIDDLDRCRPTAVLDVMETVNYLTSAGECFVIFGMASERVQAALGLAFKDIAAELVQMEGGVHLSEANADSALMKRRAYAADYLQKLVNIEIKVPDTHDQPVHQLLATPEIAPRRRVLSVYHDLKKLSPLFAVGIAVAAGLWVVSYWQPQAPAPAMAAAPPIVAQSAVLPTPAPVSQPVVIEPQREKRPASAATVQAGETTSVGTMLAWLGAAMLPLLAVGVLVLVKLLRRSRLVTRDSQNFRDALAIWTGVVAAKRSTPRAIKRFGNRLRYLAMLQQGELKDETLAESLWAWLSQRLHRTATTAPPPPVDTLAEHQLIAMGAFYEVVGTKWKATMEYAAIRWDGDLGGNSTPIDKLVRRDIFMQKNQIENLNDFLDGETEPLEYALRTAIITHLEKFNSPWPPSPAEIVVFEKLLSGVRLAGDPQPIKVAPEENNSMSGAMPTESVER
ncbi:MAG: YCF48-related protein [Gallionella sp.]|nr:YCF48-related protein [Gallionella sp.]